MKLMGWSRCAALRGSASGPSHLSLHLALWRLVASSRPRTLVPAHAGATVHNTLTPF